MRVEADEMVGGVNVVAPSATQAQAQASSAAVTVAPIASASAVSPVIRHLWQPLTQFTVCRHRHRLPRLHSRSYANPRTSSTSICRLHTDI